MAKKVVGIINLQIPAGKATPAPPVGPALSQKGLNIMEFCKAFNARTGDMTPGMPIPVVITAYADRSFVFQMKKPPVSYFLKQASEVEKGSATAGRGNAVGSVTTAQVKDIVKEKMPDLKVNSEEAGYRVVCGSARSMGIKVVSADV